MWKGQKEDGRREREKDRATSNVQRPTSNVELAAPFGRSTLDVGRWTLDVKAFWYILALFLFALGLMSKPMVVTLPFVLLLLDFWPLRRVQSLKSKVQSREIEGEQRPVKRPMDEGREPKSEVQSSRFKVHPSSVAVPVLKSRPAVGERGPEHAAEAGLRRVEGSKFVFLSLEKLPFFVLSAAGSIVTYLVQHAGGATSSLQALPLRLRVGNVLMAYIGYISKTIMPVRLSVPYAYPIHLQVGWVLAAGLIVVLITALFLARWGRQPFLTVGWLWFLGTLVPAIGLVQVGAQSMADRYMYIPSIGLF